LLPLNLASAAGTGERPPSLAQTSWPARSPAAAGDCPIQRLSGLKIVSEDGLAPLRALAIGKQISVIALLLGGLVHCAKQVTVHAFVQHCHAKPPSRRSSIALISNGPLSAGMRRPSASIQCISSTLHQGSVQRDFGPSRLPRLASDDGPGSTQISRWRQIVNDQLYAPRRAHFSVKSGRVPIPRFNRARKRATAPKSATERQQDGSE